MASIIVPLLSLGTSNLTLDEALTLIPAKDTDAAPFCRQDGAGFVSQGDWSSPHCSEDVFSSLRKSFFQRIIDQRLDKQAVAAFQTGKDEPPFSSIQLAPFRELLEEFLLAQGTIPDWSVPADQPICLHVLKQLCQCMDDPDTAVFPYLIEGVPIGTDTPILPSNCFPEQPIPDDFDPPLPIPIPTVLLSCLPFWSCVQCPFLGTTWRDFPSTFSSILLAVACGVSVRG